MKQSIKTIISIVMAFTIAIICMPMSMASEVYSGTCGDNLTWTLDTETGELVISGSSEMYNFSSENSPWSSYRDRIKKVTIEVNVESIGEYAFYFCTNLMEVTIPNSVTSIGYQAFYNCTSLTSITIPSRVISVGNSAFMNCINLASVAFEKGVRNINDYAFYDCLSLTDVYFSGAEEEWGEIKIGYGNELFLNANIHFNSTNEFVQGTCGENLIWELNLLTGELAISGMGEMDFGLEGIVPWDEYKSRIIAVTVADGITSVASYAFSDCLYLSNVLLPESLLKISSSAFMNCVNLFNINLPSNITEIGFYAFYNTGYYNDITNWSGDVLYIQNYLVKADESLQGEYTIKSGTKILADYAFANCTYVTRIKFPNSVIRIGKYVFIYCNSLTNVDLGHGLKYIGTASFDACEKLENIFIPESVIGIENAKDSTNFCGCPALVRIDVDSGNKYYCSDSYGVLFDKSKVTLIKYPEGSDNTYYKIPDSVKSVGDAAFDKCLNLSSVYIPESVTFIGNCSFMVCDVLKDVYYNGTKKEWSNISIHYYNSALLNSTIHFLGESEHEHELTHRTVASTCTVAGMEYDMCLECGESFNIVTLPLAAHSWTQWMTRTEATGSAYGEKYRTCTVCGKEETDSIPKLNVIEDEKTGIEIEFDNEYNSDVEIKVEEVFDGSSFELLEKAYGGVKSKVFDISTIKDGIKVQPNGKVKVRIPLPNGFGKNPVWVNYIDSVNGTVTKIPSIVVNGYVEFETDHFSYYAVVEELGKVSSVSIDNISMNYKDSTTVTPSINADAGVKYTVSYSSSDTGVAQVDANGKVTATGKGSATITCTVTDEYDNTVTDTCKVEVKYSWWQWIIVIVLFGWIWY